MTIKAGEILNGRYEVQRMIGQGGMSTVWLGHDPRLNRSVAIKMIHAFLLNHADFLDRFQREAAAIASLRHQNIIQVFDYNQHVDSHYMVLEYVPGNNLKQELAAQTPNGILGSTKSVLDLMVRLTDAVGYAHENGMLHRDLKPDNVLLRATGEPVLTDFGIIKLMADDSVTRTGTVLGTAAYMAPEQIEGGQVNAQSDLYALGVMLFELISGQRPFVADSPIRLMMKQSNELPPLLSSMIEDEGRKAEAVKLEPIIYKILAKSAHDRYQSAVEFSSALKQALATIERKPILVGSSLHKIEIAEPIQPDLSDVDDFTRESKPVLFIEPDEAKQQALADITRINKQLEIDPLREDQVQQQMLLHARTGNFAGSLRGYAQLQRRFAEELGIDPLPETLALRDRILSARLSPLHNLKPDSSQFVGREQELATVSARLSNGDDRLLTLLGPGGMGKTRLGRAVIRKLASADWRYFLHGIWFVPLAPIDIEVDPQALIYAIIQACNIPVSGKVSPQTQLFNWFSDREALLVLDNFEHIISQADWIGELLQQAPNLKILVTSRQRLNISDEHIYPIYGFSNNLPSENVSPREMLDDGSRLFLLTSRKLQPNFRPDTNDLQSIRQICSLVNGMPLGIELAASWTRMLSCQEIVAEIQGSIDFLATNLRRLPDRHRSMRAVFAYSWDLLDEAEQNALMNLSLIRGQFTLETAQVIGQTDIDIITSLVDKSLIQAFVRNEVDETITSLAYSLHEITRHYSEELLKQSTNAMENAAARYTRWFISLLNQQLEPMYGSEQFYAAEAVHFSFNDMLHSWQDALINFGWNHLDLVTATNAIGKYFQLQGFDRLGSDVLRKALDTLPTAAPDQLRMVIQNRLSGCLFRLADYPLAEEMAQSALETAEEQGVLDEIRKANMILGHVAMKTGQTEMSIERGKKALAFAEQAQNLYGQAIAHNFIGGTTYVSGQFGEAFFHYEEALKLFTQLEDDDNISRVKANMALPSVMVGQYQKALDIFEYDLELSRKWRSKTRLATILLNIAWVRTFVKDFTRADDEIDESLVYFREAGDAEGEATAFIVMGHIDAVQEDYIPARSHFLDAVRIAHTIQAVPKLTEAIAGLALFIYELDGEVELAWKISQFCKQQTQAGSMTYSRAETVIDRIGDKITAEQIPALQATVDGYELDQIAMAMLHHQFDEL